jgi:hypothetical protein
MPNRAPGVQSTSGHLSRVFEQPGVGDLRDMLNGETIRLDGAIRLAPQ